MYIYIYERGYIFRDAVFVAPPGTCCNERSRTCWRTPQRAYASESHVSTHDGCCCPATLTAAFQFNAIVNMQYLTFTLSLVYIYVCFQFNTIVNMQYLYYTILSVYLNIYTYIHTYIYIMNLNNIPMLHFVFQPLLQRQFSACHERH